MLRSVASGHRSADASSAGLRATVTSERLPSQHCSTTADTAPSPPGSMHRVSKKSQNCFWHNFVKLSLSLLIFGTKMAKMIGLCKVHTFSTSPNFWQRTTVWNSDAPNWYIVTLLGDYLYQLAHLCIIDSTEGATWLIIFVVLNVLVKIADDKIADKWA